MPQNLNEDRISTEGISYIKPKDAERLNRYLVRPGDIVYSRRGDVTKRAQVGKAQDGWLCGTGCLRVRFGTDEINPRFAFYYMGHSLVKEWIRRHAIGATLPNLNTSILSALPFLVPPSRDQRAIAQMLGTLDDKIELNRRMNETLEAMARAIFKSWFVDFDPVRAKTEGRQPFGMDAATAALFPDSFQDFPLGKIPNAWKIDEIKSQAKSIQYGLTRSSAPDPVGPRFLRITDIQGGRVNWGQVPFCPVSAEEKQKYRICRGDILIARTGASTGENIYIIDTPDAVFASYLVRIQFADLSLARVVGEYMRTATYFDYVAGAIGGSAQPNASAQVLASAAFAFPPACVAKRFAELVERFDRQRVENFRQIETLTSIRDALLPKLISGEIRVRNFEKHIEEVVS
jgi:type I restriction enzyme S subunit